MKLYPGVNELQLVGWLEADTDKMAVVVPLEISLVLPPGFYIYPTLSGVAAVAEYRHDGICLIASL